MLQQYVARYYLTGGTCYNTMIHSNLTLSSIIFIFINYNYKNLWPKGYLCCHCGEKLHVKANHVQWHTGEELIRTTCVYLRLLLCSFLSRIDCSLRIVLL